jgi:hypothetical protein
MEIPILFIVFVIAAVIFVKSIKATRLEQKQKRVLQLDDLPELLGIRDDLHLQPLVERLENALDDRYIEKVKQRLLEKGKIKEDEFKSHFFELKRIVILTTVLGYNPMYNDKVDEIQHGMTLFTKEYEDFCRRFSGQLVDHSENIEKNPHPEERAWFEWVYTQLFTHLPYTKVMYGEFFKRPLSQVVIKDFEKKSQMELKKKYFRITRSEEIENVLNALVQKTQQNVHHTKLFKPGKGDYLRAKNEEDFTTLAFIMLYYSSLSETENDYVSHIASLEIENSAQNQAAKDAASP